ncbi:MAG: hypothetical protein O2955_09330 [Planctomycetota bacterium]|nr:hypothetical protein [Planctomycetota bacterium]MDA1212710.1 hypothetical protein [Planctomycetota bacterium]
MSNDRKNEYETLKENPDALPPDVWNLTVDPPKEELQFEPDRKTVRIKVPVAGNRTTAGAIVFPVVPSPFVAVGANELKGDIREIWNLCTGKKVGKISDLNVKTAEVALSPDARYFAGVVDVRGSRGSSIGIYDVEAQEIIGNIEMNERSDWLSIGFSRPDMLLVMEHWGERQIHAYEIPSMELLYTIPIGRETWNKFPPVFSPGGKYLAWTYRQFIAEMIAVYDMDRGELAGSMTLPEYDIHGQLRLHGLAFSPDGTELAAIVDSWECSKVVIYSMATGEITDHMTFPKKLQTVVTGQNSPWASYNPLVFFPKNQRLLAFEHGVIDRSVGELVWSVPRSLVNFPGKRWPLDPSHLTVIDVANNSASVFVYELPEEKISNTTQRLTDRKSKQEIAPSNIARVENTTYVEEHTYKLIVPETAEWKLIPNAPSETAPPSKPIPLRRAIGKVQQVSVSGGSSSKAAVMRGTGWPTWERIPKGNVNPFILENNRKFSIKDDNVFNDPNRVEAGVGSGRSRCWIDLYDLGQGNLSRQIRLAYDADLLGLSPDGSRLLLWAARRQDRLDIYDTETGNLVVSWEPSGSFSSLTHLTGARMIGNDRICTLDNGGGLLVWRIDTAGEKTKVVKDWEMMMASQPAVSPDGRYVGYSDGEIYHLIDIQTGEVAGQIPDIGDVYGVAFHPRGTRLAILSEYKGGYYLFTVDLSKGEVSPPFPVPVLTPFLEWCGERYILLDHQKLVDIEQRVVAWTYELPAGDHLPSTPDGRHWYLAPTGRDNQIRPVLAAVELPTSDAVARLQNVALGPEFVLQPGGTCSISSQLGQAGGISSEAIKHFTEELAKHNTTVSPNQPVTLLLSVTESIGETNQMEFVSFSSRPNQTINHTSKRATCKLQFISGGEVAWETSQVIGNYTSWVRTSGEQSINDAIEQDYQASIKGFFTTQTLPPYVFTPRASNGIGKTVLTASPRQTRL